MTLKWIFKTLFGTVKTVKNVNNFTLPNLNKKKKRFSDI